MRLLTPIENSQSTLDESYSTSTKSVISDDDSDSDLSLNECDMTLVDDHDLVCDPKNEAEMMFYQVVEMLRYEQEVCLLIFKINFFMIFNIVM